MTWNRRWKKDKEGERLGEGVEGKQGGGEGEGGSRMTWIRSRKRMRWRSMRVDVEEK